MLLMQEAWKEIKKKQIDLELTNIEMSEKLGLKTKRSYTDMLVNIKLGRGYIADNKVLKLSEILGIDLKKFAN